MDFSPKDVIDAAQRIIHSPAALVGASAPQAQAPERAAAAQPAVTIRTLGPSDPAPFDREHPSLFSCSLRPALVLIVLAIVAAAVLHK